jgi:hypothetical protein
MRNAKELCSLLITRGIKNLSEDEEDIVVDYLDSIGIDVSIDDKPRDMCETLLRKLMEEKSNIPLTAFANKVLADEKNKKEQIIQKKKQIVQEKAKKKKESELKIKRISDQSEIAKMENNLPGCIKNNNIFEVKPYWIQVDDRIGVQTLSDGTAQYKAIMTLPYDVYFKIVSEYQSYYPVVEIKVGNKTAYAGIEPYDGPILISPLIRDILELNDYRTRLEAYLSFCNSMPIIKSIVFTYYGSQEELDKFLPDMIHRLPETINAFAYLSLGLVLRTIINGQETLVRVDRLVDSNDDLVFAGISPDGESDIPFEIYAEYSLKDLN